MGWVASLVKWGGIPEATGTNEETLENKHKPLIGIMLPPFPHRKNNSARVATAFGGSFFFPIR